MSQIVVNDLHKDFYVNVSKGSGVTGMVKSLFSREKKTVEAVKGLDFKIEEGEMVGFLGPNGAGKSTTIKMLTGILTPSSGEISVCGLTPCKKRQQNAKNIGVVFGQRTQLWWDLPVKESFLLLKKMYEIEAETYEDNIAYFTDLLEMEDFLDRPVRQLSLGQRMRCDLAAAFLHNPKIIYLDEPTIGLDITSKKRIRECIKETNRKRKTTIILTTHDMADVEQLADRVMVINHGKMIYDGDMTGLQQQYRRSRNVVFTLKDSRVAFTGFMMDNQQIEWQRRAEELILKVPASVSAGEVISMVMAQYPVEDVRIEETPIEDIIEEIYNQ
ncbi:MAG: ATP-binding cassette domain-containing protein [Lachnospiraceae bacterium]|nr:ATP-binding cassette domain-containing protein [Lachnospiraceae bacterium]MBD5396016.1 ATP-binding cassette domain-containing protein [Lachnospiraceae bacterium]